MVLKVFFKSSPTSPRAVKKSANSKVERNVQEGMFRPWGKKGHHLKMHNF